MKLIKIVMVSALLLASLTAMTAKVEEQAEKRVYQVLKSEKVDHCTKPGLPVELEYSSEHVDTGVVSNVNITIFTTLIEGVLKVNVKALEGLDFEEKDFRFKLSKEEKNEFSLALEVLSSINGKHYLTFELSVEGKGGRIVEVPVKFGTIMSKPQATNVEKTQSGVNISVSKAIEEIK